MLNLSYSSSKNAGSHNEGQHTSHKITLWLVLVLPWHLWQLKGSSLSLSVWVVFSQTAIHCSSLWSPLVQNTQLMQLFNYGDTCFSCVNETCGLDEILTVSVCEFSFGFIGWIASEESCVGQFWKTTDKADEGLLLGIFDSVSGSNILEAVRDETLAENESLGVGSVLVLLDQQR